MCGRCDERLDVFVNVVELDTIVPAGPFPVVGGTGDVDRPFLAAVVTVVVVAAAVVAVVAIPVVSDPASGPGRAGVVRVPVSAFFLADVLFALAFMPPFFVPFFVFMWGRPYGCGGSPAM